MAAHFRHSRAAFYHRTHPLCFLCRMPVLKLQQSQQGQCGQPKLKKLFLRRVQGNHPVGRDKTGPFFMTLTERSIILVMMINKINMPALMA